MNAEPAAVDWMAVVNEQFRGRAVLSTEEAWTIAMTWEEDVRQKVALKISRPTSVIETYSWIEFREADRGWRYAGGGPETALAVRSQRYAEAVRATMLTWLALSSCPGFQVHENPIFWKYVLGELREPKDKSLPRPSVSDVSSESFNPVKDARRMADDVLTHVCISFNALYCRVVSGLAPSFDAEINSQTRAHRFTISTTGR